MQKRRDNSLHHIAAFWILFKEDYADDCTWVKETVGFLISYILIA